MRAVSGGKHSLNLRAIEESKHKISKTRIAVAGGALATII